MSLNIENIKWRNVSHVQNTVKNEKNTSKPSNGRHFDEVMISASRGGESEQEIKARETLSRSVKLEVRTNTPEEKVEAIKNAVREGHYKIDTDKIASAMLLSRGEFID